ncbi:MAG: hypothetical protein AB7G47_19350 [Mycolicibacterium sp.]|uniref:hypothetical protein n=1 Tax=Mycolicibacterium sp. TaxID=2320850 RepID=UPI003D127F87
MTESTGHRSAVDTPWDAPVAELPDHVTPRWCAQTLTTAAGNAIVRSHLEPRSEDRRYRLAWERLWRMISFDPRWRRMTRDMLIGDRDRARRALDAGGLSAKDATRVRTYLHATSRALERIERESAAPLAWASASYAEVGPRTRETIEALALTVDDYLSGQATREDLRAVLAGLDLNPAQRDVPEQARERARAHRRPHAR